MSALQEYYKIINFRLKNPILEETYVEKHHIKPRSIYPELAKEQSNIVKLLPEEHYKCHALLPKIYKDLGDKNGYEKMLFAWNMIASTRKDLTIDEQATEYARLREEFRKVVSEANSRKNNPMKRPEVREKISKALSGKNSPMYGKHLSAETKKKLSEANSGKRHPMYGKHLSAETKKKMSEANSGKRLSAETKKKMSEAHSGKHHSEETKKKLSEANSGKHHSEEAREKMRLAAKKRWERYHQQKAGIL